MRALIRANLHPRGKFLDLLDLYEGDRENYDKTVIDIFRAVGYAPVTEDIPVTEDEEEKRWLKRFILVWKLLKTKRSVWLMMLMATAQYLSNHPQHGRKTIPARTPIEQGFGEPQTG